MDPSLDFISVEALWLGGGNITSYYPSQFSVTFDNVQVTAVPEPAGLALLAIGGACCGLAGLRRRRAATD